MQWLRINCEVELVIFILLMSFYLLWSLPMIYYCRDFFFLNERIKTDTNHSYVFALDFIYGMKVLASVNV